MPLQVARIDNYVHDYICDKCGAGKMRPKVRNENQPNNQLHICVYCGYEEEIEGKPYPRTVKEYMILPDPYTPPPLDL